MDHIYIDGVELASYASQGSSAGAQTSGNFYLGSSNVSLWSSSGFNGTYFRFRTYPTQLASSDVALVSNAIRNEVSGRGVPVTPLAIASGAPMLHAIGDSVTYGLGVSTPWPSLLSLTNQPNYAITNWGIGGVTAQALNASEPNRVALRCQATQGPAIAIVFEGTNDIVNATTATVFANIVSHVKALKQAGCMVFVGTILSRSGSDNLGNTIDADKDSLDALILGNVKAIGADGVIDFAANPLLGADGAYAGSMFQGDHLHPTQAGQALLATAASNVLNYSFGYNEMNVHSVTTLPYSMTAADGYVSTAGVTSVGTLTLPDCTGQSGATYRINNSQAAYAVTVVPMNASQLINGRALSNGVPVPANGSVTLRDIPNAKSVSGCHWEM
jgi:lysophospholipase L1-like esterase